MVGAWPVGGQSELRGVGEGVKQGSDADVGASLRLAAAKASVTSAGRHENAFPARPSGMKAVRPDNQPHHDALHPRLPTNELVHPLQILPRPPHRASRDRGERCPDLEVRAHIHLDPSFPGVPFRREQRDRNLPAAATLPPWVQAFPRAPQGIRPAPTIEAIQRDRRGGDIRLPDPAPHGVLPRVARPGHGDSIGSRNPQAIPSEEERTGKLALDEPRDRPAIVLHALKVDAQPDRAVAGVVPGVPLDTLVAVRDAQEAEGQAAEFPSTASEHVSEAAPQDIGVIGGNGHEPAWGGAGRMVRECRSTLGPGPESGIAWSRCHGRPPESRGGKVEREHG